MSCRAPASGGEANSSIRSLVAGWLGVPDNVVRWVSAGRSRSKVLEVEGLSEAEVARRLEKAGAGSDR